MEQAVVDANLLAHRLEVEQRERIFCHHACVAGRKLAVI